MKASLQERFRKGMLRFGKKNKLSRLCVIPVMAAGLACIHAAAYIRGNGKRFAVLALTLLLGAVYSSFSFPGFSADAYGLNSISDEARGIAFSEENNIDPEELDRLDEDNRVPEEYYEANIPGAGAVTDPGTVKPGAGQGSSGYEGHDVETWGDAVRFSADDWRLTLVNPQHPMPENYEVALGDVATIKGILQCDERIIDDWLSMQRAAREEGVRIVICSTYRDEAYQKSLFNGKLTRYMNMGLSYLEAYQRTSEYVNVPNGSEHQLGLAFDIVTPTFLDLEEDFENTQAGKWLAANCHKYGFILRYPRGKEFITGVEYEPWHFRYVGREAAGIIMGEGITLEEFWEEYL